MLDLDELRACGLSDNAVSRTTAARAAPPHSPRRLRLGPRGPDDEGPVARGGKGVRPRRRAEPPRRGRAVEPAPLGRGPAAGRDRAGQHGTRRVPGVNVHRTRNPPHIVRFDRIPVTTPARTLVDLSSVLPFKPHRRAVREAMALKRVTLKELREAQEQDNSARSSPTATSPRAPNSRTPSSTSSRNGGFTTTRRQQTDPASASPPTSAGPTSASSSRPTARTGTTTRSRDEDDADRQAILEAHGERVLRVTWKQTVAKTRRDPPTNPKPQARPVRCS